MNEFKKNLWGLAGMRILIFLVSLFVCTLTGALIAAFFTVTNNIVMIKIGQGISSAMMFIAPPLILYLVTRNQPMQYLGFRKPFRWWALLTGIVLMFISLPLTNILGDWNAGIKIGGAFEVLEDWLKTFDEASEALIERMMNVNTVWGLLGNLLVLALIPAIGEELTFRGVLQQALTRGCKNVHLAVFISAFVFSFIHMQFSGFLPRMFLGMLLGYMFYYTGSIWTSILMHFINNGFIVVIYYLNNKGLANIDVEHFGSPEGWECLGNTGTVMVYVLSLLLTVGAIVLVAKKQSKYGRK